MIGLKVPKDSVSTTITVTESSPKIEYEIEYGSTLIENVESDWSLELTNEGEKWQGEITARLYWNEEDEDNLMVETPQTRIEIDESKVLPEELTPADTDDSLLLVIEDSSKGVLLVEVDIDTKKAPELSISRIVWVDDKDPYANSNEVISFSDGSVAYAKIFLDNKGSFDVGYS